ncbi:hypothetical protein [Micromonospora chersina]|uniref:Uncharacterized protein n=1 Tax=Micromonospora chersina TaxID=47854 RepID=A0A1C6ULY4_9ACTN|nr:hypothetical protein [Micromonospora chersina]SCL55008.1 hypothetical protein GA0070603_1917 [Micromonospora chersina]
MTRWTESIELPSAWVHAYGPRVCARHGEPAEDLRRVTLRPKMPAWVWICAVVAGGTLGFACGVFAAVPVALLTAIVERQVRKPMNVPGWPYCPRCFTLHRISVVGTAAVVLGLATYVLGFALFLLGVLRHSPGVPSDGTLALIMVGSLLALAGALTRPWFSWQKLAGAHVSRDHGIVRVVAHGRFAADVRERLTARTGRARGGRDLLQADPRG